MQVETHNNKTKTSPRKFLYLEIDVEMQIIDTIKVIQISYIEFIHVKRNQDNNKIFDNLTWLLKINIYCDQLETKALDTHKAILEHILLLSASIIQLKL